MCESESQIYRFGKHIYWSSQKVADYLGVRRLYVLRMTKKGKIPYTIHPVNEKYCMYKEKDVVDLLKSWENKLS